VSYMSISFHPSITTWNKSPEEIRLEHYNLCYLDTRPPLSDTSKLMVTRQLSALPSRFPSRPIRAEANSTHKYAVTKRYLRAM
jgi:hypothetical protein